MVLIYLKQAWNMLRANPLISIVSVAGTAISIAMIMVVVLVNQIQVAGYAPEYHRDRMLYANGIRAVSDNTRIGAYMSPLTVKECFYSLESAELVTAYNEDYRPVSLPSRRLFKEYCVKYTDPSFWKIFEFSFLEGAPFTESDFDSAIPCAVISKQLAKELFGKTNVVGETVILDFLSYRVSGVVKDVSEAATDAYGHIWVPYTTNTEFMTLDFGENICGMFKVCILAHSRSDFDTIRDELDRRITAYNQTKSTFTMQMNEQPIDRIAVAMGGTTFGKPDWKDFMMQLGGLLLFLILVPAINLTGVNQSSVQQRTSEMGVRKSFGATGWELIMQVVTENMVITLIGGVIGFALSYVFLLAGKSFLLPTDPVLNLDMLFQPVTFLLAFLFILSLNMLSAFIPAIRITKWTIVDSLKTTN